MSDDRREAVERAILRHLLPASDSAVVRLGATLNALLDGARSDPRTLDHPNAVRSLKQDLLAAFHRALTLPLGPVKRVEPAVRRGGLKRAVDYLRAADPASATVSNLCSAACVTGRTLQYAFRESFGLSPFGILHLRRYHAARRDLLAADCWISTVRTSAQYNGFYQLGRFAVRYKALFGESPSHTLMKPPQVTQPHLPSWHGSSLR